MGFGEWHEDGRAADREAFREKQERDQKEWDREEARLRKEDDEFAAYYILTEMDKKDNGEKSDCFVTTAAYGDAHHPMVQAFRALRDEVLVNHKIGRALNNAYNKYGPKIADFIRPKPLFCAAARAVLTPVAKAVVFVRGKRPVTKRAYQEIKRNNVA